jgi:glycosyltransferase involved in cell wall biosynthesis
MKILQINAVNSIGSTGRICSEITDYLNENFFEGYIAYSNGFPHEKGYKVGTSLESKVHALNSRVFGTQAYFSKTGTKKLIMYIEEIKPDVIHLHNLHGNFINLAILINYLADNDIATVITLHDCWFFTGKCTHYTVDGCFKWQTGCGNCPRLKKDNPSWFFDRTNKMYKDKKEWFGRIPRLAVVGVSEWITNEAKKSFLSSAKVIKKIYNWIDLNTFRPVDTASLRQKLGLNNKFIILGVSSGWSEAKGLNKFIELSKHITDDSVIILVGNISANIKLPKNVININETHNVNELVEYYSMADVFLNLSLEETFGKVTAEALACGTPAITNNSTANPELIGEGCGYINEISDIKQITQNILKIKEVGKELYSKNCIEYVKNNFDINDKLKEYTSLYKKLVAL